MKISKIVLVIYLLSFFSSGVNAAPTSYVGTITGVEAFSSEDFTSPFNYFGMPTVVVKLSTGDSCLIIKLDSNPYYNGYDQLTSAATAAWTLGKQVKLTCQLGVLASHVET